MPDDRDLNTRLRELVGEVYRDREFLDLTSAWVDGVEVTQAIQWYGAGQHLTDPADRGPDNGITLVAYKPAWVRVYVGGIIAHSNIGARVMLQRHNVFGAWDDFYPLSPQGYSRTDYNPKRSYKDTRGSLFNTLNFVIPASEMHGRFQLAVTLEDGTDSPATSTITVDATLRQTLQIRGIPIRYWGADAAGNQVQLGPTTAADFISTATWTMLTYPVENVPSVSLAGIFTWSESLAGAADVPGGCSTGWYDLLMWLNVAKTLDGSRPNVMYYGLLPAGTPDGPVTGCDTGGASAAKNGDGVAMAHEMGHFQGYPHAPCGAVGTPDPNYPAYEPYDSVAARTASIGEYGLDVSTGTIYDPAVAKDYMSYCSPPWTSLYHYRSQLLSPLFNPRYVSSGDRPPWWDHYKLYRDYVVERDLPRPPGPVEEYLVHQEVEIALQPSIVLTGVLRDGQLEVRSVLRVDSVQGDGDLAAERLEVLDANGDVIGRSALRQSPATGCGGGGGWGGGGRGGGGCGGCAGRTGCGAAGSSCPSVVQAVVPASDRVAAIRVLRGEDVLWSREAPERPPAAPRLKAEARDNEVALAWRSSGEDGELSETHLRISSDHGETWSLLELRASGSETTIPMQLIAPGNHLVHVVVSDGFHTVTSEAVEIEVPQRPPTATIHWPLNTATVAATASLRLWGTGASATGEVVGDAAHTWTIDGTPVGDGRDIWVRPPEAEGEHEAVLTVRDQYGETSVSSRFWVTHSGQAFRRLS